MKRHNSTKNVTFFVIMNKKYTKTSFFKKIKNSVDGSKKEFIMHLTYSETQ